MIPARFFTRRTSPCLKSLLVLVCLALLRGATVTRATAAHVERSPQPVSCSTHPEAARITLALASGKPPVCFAGDGFTPGTGLLHLTDVEQVSAGANDTRFRYRSGEDASTVIDPETEGGMDIFLRASQSTRVSGALGGQTKTMTITSLWISPYGGGINGKALPTGIHQANCHAQSDLVTLFYDQGQACLGFANTGLLPIIPIANIEKVCSGNNKGKIAYRVAAMSLPETEGVSKFGITGLSILLDKPWICVTVAQALHLPTMTVNQITIFPA